MEIVVNHLTRMANGYVCVAGLHRDGRHIRPVLNYGRLERGVCADFGGPFSIGGVVELGPTTPRPTPPEVEDHVFDPARARAVRAANPERLWRFMDERAICALTGIFGDSLARQGATAVMPEGTGVASLGLYRPGSRPRLTHRSDKLRVSIDDPDLGWMSLPLTDVRLYDLERNSVDGYRVALLEDRLRRRPVLLSVGVGRAWAPDGEEPRHWLQVNNIHLDDNPLWPR